MLIETDLMEWKEGSARGCQAPLDLTLHPFEIKTFKLA